MRAVLIWIAAVFVFGSFYALERQKETVWQNGQTAYLVLAPVYSRPAKEGDCLALNYEIANALGHLPYEIIRTNRSSPGLMVVRLDSQKVATLVGLYQGSALAPGEHLLRFHLERWRVVISSQSYSLPEGSARQDLQGAAYGELKISPDGTSLLVALCDSERHRLVIRPPREL